MHLYLCKLGRLEFIFLKTFLLPLPPFPGCSTSSNGNVCAVHKHRRIWVGSVEKIRNTCIALLSIGRKLCVYLSQPFHLSRTDLQQQHQRLRNVTATSLEKSASSSFLGQFFFFFLILKVLPDKLCEILSSMTSYHCAFKFLPAVLGMLELWTSS